MAIHAFDLLSGTLDGMSSAGLVVAILADEEATNALGPHLEMHPGAQHVIGLHELQVMRLLLDTCATVEEAKAALLTIKQYYRFMPNHYIVADRAGHSFIYENSTGRNVQHVLDGNGQRQVITNHQVYKQGVGAPMPVPPRLKTTPCGATRRCGTVLLRITAVSRPRTSQPTWPASIVYDLLPIIGASAAPGSTAAGVQARTMWRRLYDQQAGTVAFSFYLGEDVQADGTRTEVRSGLDPRYRVDGLVAVGAGGDRGKNRRVAGHCEQRKGADDANRGQRYARDRSQCVTGACPASENNGQATRQSTTAETWRPER